MWLRDLMDEFSVASPSATALFCDNEADVRISHDPVCLSRTKHVSNAFWFVREVQEDEVIKVIPSPTKSQLADFLTKPLNRPAFESNLSLTGMTNVPQTLGLVKSVFAHVSLENELMDELFGCDCPQSCSCGK
jgi:hypothetical protein